MKVLLGQVLHLEAAYVRNLANLGVSHTGWAIKHREEGATACGARFCSGRIKFNDRARHQSCTWIVYVTELLDCHKGFTEYVL